MLASNVVRMQDKAQTDMDVEVEQAILLTSISFIDVDGQEVNLPRGMQITVDTVKKVALASGVHFDIFADEYRVLSSI